MKLKEYMTYVEKHIPADSEKPTDVVQMLACLIGNRLGNRVPAACGTGINLDMDIVQAGILAGLERIKAHDPSQGTMRQFLYPTIAGAMQSYAWERENRVADSRPQEWPYILDIDEDFDAEEPNLIDQSANPETQMIREEEAVQQVKSIRAAVKGLGQEATAMLIRDAQIGYDPAKRQAWADEIGVTVGALSMRLSRLRKQAREWALTEQ